jgi:TRAP-type C4-dicarboxylate transport system substrate-binding protein
LLVGVVAASAGFSWMLRSSTTRNNSVQVLKLAHTLDPKHPVHLAMEFMAQRLREKSGGNYEDIRCAARGLRP